MRAPRSGALGAALLLSSATALAAEPGPSSLPITVVAIQTPDADDQAEALTKALRAELRAAPGWSLGVGDYALEVLTISLKCTEPPDAGCQARIADQIQADRYIWGDLRKERGEVAGTLHLWTRGKPSTAVPVRYSGNLTEAQDESLRKIASGALTELTGGLPKGSVHVKAASVDGAVFVDGTEVGVLRAGEGTFDVAVGSHQIVVKAKGYGDAASSVLVKPSATADVALFPMPIEVKKPLDWRRIGGYAGVGAGVVFAVVALAGTIQVASVQGDIEEFRKVNYASNDVCADAESGVAADAPGTTKAQAVALCDKAGTFEVVQAVFYPLAAVSAGAGAYLLLTRPKDSSPDKGLRVAPRVGTSGGGVDLSYTW